MAVRPESSLTVLPYSSHRIQDDYPGMVVTAIHQMLFPNAEKGLRKTLQEKRVDSCMYCPIQKNEGSLSGWLNY